MRNIVRKKIAEIDTRMADFKKLQTQYQAPVPSENDKQVYIGHAQHLKDAIHDLKTGEKTG